MSRLSAKTRSNLPVITAALALAWAASCASTDGAAAGGAYQGAFLWEERPSGVWITGYTGAATDVWLPAEIGGRPVVAVDRDAFMGRGLSNVNIPQGVALIGPNAFRGNNLTYVALPDSVRVIERGAFMANDLSEVTFGAGLERIEHRAFSGNRLASVEIPRGGGERRLFIERFAFANNEIASVSIEGNAHGRPTASGHYFWVIGADGLLTDHGRVVFDGNPVVQIHLEMAGNSQPPPWLYVMLLLIRDFIFIPAGDIRAR